MKVAPRPLGIQRSAYASAASPKSAAATSPASSRVADGFQSPPLASQLMARPVMASCAVRPVAIDASQNARRPNHVGFSIRIRGASCFDQLSRVRVMLAVEWCLGVLRLALVPRSNRDLVAFG